MYGKFHGVRDTFLVCEMWPKEHNHKTSCWLNANRATHNVFLADTI